MTMNKQLILAALAALTLGGCAMHQRHGGGMGPGMGRGDPARPQVTVDGNAIKLSQEVLVFPPGFSGTVTWQLPANSPYRFPENGIVIEGRLTDQVLREKQPSVVLDPRQTEITECRRANEGLAFTCFNKNSLQAAYKYTIRLRGPSGQIERDPPWVNMGRAE
jgi:hypothetical protein